MTSAKRKEQWRESKRQHPASELCRAKGCKNDPVPGYDLCDYHLDLEEDGTPVPRKVKPFTPVLTPEQILAAKLRAAQRHLENYVSTKTIKAERRSLIHEVFAEIRAKREERRIKRANR